MHVDRLHLFGNTHSDSENSLRLPNQISAMTFQYLQPADHNKAGGHVEKNAFKCWKFSKFWNQKMTVYVSLQKKKSIIKIRPISLPQHHLTYLCLALIFPQFVSNNPHEYIRSL